MPGNPTLQELESCRILLRIAWSRLRDTPASNNWGARSIKSIISSKCTISFKGQFRLGRCLRM